MSSFSLISNRSSYQPGGRKDGGVSHLTVGVRVRPLSDKEKRKGASQVIYKVDDQMVVMMDPADKLNEFLRANRSKEKKFMFDQAFGPESTQEEVYGRTSSGLVDSVLDGFNATVFAYGATGAGKTFTMLGTPESPGVMARALEDLFDRMDAHEEKAFAITMSYLEIYNETIRDLLVPKSKVLDLREDKKGTVHIAGLSELKAVSSSEVLTYLLQGNARRTQEPTDANKESSRSHAVLQVNLVSRSKDGGVQGRVGFSKLFMVDLAGSERAANTKNRGKRLKEGAHINRSLLALGNVINGLTEKNLKYVNYRDSKLTRLLKDSLGGNSKTVMIAHVSPASDTFEESRTTLHYADRAKNITTKFSAQTEDVTAHVSQYQSIISDLRREIARLRGQIDSNNHSGGGMARSVSSVSLGSPEDEGYGGGHRRQKSDVGRASDSASSHDEGREFDETKAKLVGNFKAQKELRQQLMEQNIVALDAATTLSAKGAILQAWDEKNNPNFDKDKPDHLGPKAQPDSIKALRKDVVRQQALSEAAEARRSEVEWDLAVLVKKAQKLQDAAPARSKEHRDVLDLLVRLHEAEVEKLALQSDGVLLNRRLRAQESSLQTVQKYHGVVSQLVSHQQSVIKDNSVAIDAEGEELLDEYKTTKSRAHFSLIPLNREAETLSQRSWNRDLLDQEKERSASARLSRTMGAGDLAQVKSSQSLQRSSSKDSGVHLPPIRKTSAANLGNIREKADRRRRESVPSSSLPPATNSAGSVDRRRKSPAKKASTLRRSNSAGRSRPAQSRKAPAASRKNTRTLPKPRHDRRDKSPIQYLPILR